LFIKKKLKLKLKLNIEIIYGNKVDKLKLLIQKADKNNIILNINERYNDFNSPLSLAIKKDNIEMVKIFIDYAESHNIGLSITNDDKKYKSKINAEILDLIEQYNKNSTEKPSISYNNNINNSNNINININNLNRESNSYQLNQSHALPRSEMGIPIQNQTQPLTQSQSELLNSLLSQPPNVLITILSQLQASLQLLQSQLQFSHNLSPPQSSSSTSIPNTLSTYGSSSIPNFHTKYDKDPSIRMSHPIYDNGSSPTPNDPPQYNNDSPIQIVRPIYDNGSSSVQVPPPLYDNNSSNNTGDLPSYTEFAESLD